MEIQHRVNDTDGMFFIETNDRIVAEMTYYWSGTDRIIIDHTQVSNELKGKGIGKLLVTAAVEFARQKNSKIVPLCSFAKKVFDNTNEFNDVL